MGWGARPHLLNGHRCFDRRVRIIACDDEIVELVIEQTLRTTLEVKLRQRLRIALQQLLNLLKVVGVDVDVTACPNELADLQVTLLRQHVYQQSIAGDVERQAEEHVA